MNVNVRPSPAGHDLQSCSPSDRGVTKPRRLILGVHAGVSRRDGGRKDTQVSLDETIRIAQTADEAARLEAYNRYLAGLAAEDADVPGGSAS